MDIQGLIAQFIAAVILVFSGAGLGSPATPTEDAPPVIVLGDSYAQGFGVLRAEEYRNALWPGTVNLARTGTATYEMNSQFIQLNDEISAGFVPAAAIIILGGNDLDLLTAIQQCFFIDCPTPAQLQPRLASLKPQLVTIFQHIDEIVNSSDLQAARGGAEAPIIVGSYPILLSTPGPVAIGPLNVSEINVDRINQIVVELNSTVADAVAAAQETAVGDIRFVDMSNLFDGHRFGDTEPYLSINGHPNSMGYQAILTAFNRTLSND